MTSASVAFNHIIPEQRMKVSLFPDLNDPFELMSHDIGNREVRAKAQAYGAEAGKRLGLICFSDNWQSPVMWAHYAEKHNGVCLGFDIHDEFLAPVRYLKNRALLKGNKEIPIKNDDFISQILHHKAQEWRYERELRAIVLLDSPKRPIYHVPFGADMQLRELIVGCRNPLAPRDLEPFILSQETPVNIIKARPAFKKFEMVPNCRYKVVTVPAARDCRSLHGAVRVGPRFLRLCENSPLISENIGRKSLLMTRFGQQQP